MSQHIPVRSTSNIRFLAFVFLGLLICASGMLCSGSYYLLAPSDPVIADMLAPAPSLPRGFYDFFGSLKNPDQARQMVLDAGLDPAEPSHFARLGLIEITDPLIQKGRDLFFKEFLGDPLAIGGILNFGAVFGKQPSEILVDSFDPAKDPSGALSFFRDTLVTALIRPKVSETNLRVIIRRDLRIGSQVIPAGTLLDTGADVATGELFPVGFEGGNISCSLCHAAVDPYSGRAVPGMPNTDLNIRLFIAVSSNTSATFLRLNHADFDPFDPRFPMTGRRIIDSTGKTVQLPDPQAFEDAVDDFVMTSVPFGSFEAAPDATTAVTKIPDNFVFGEGGMGWDGGFQIGPFGGIAAFTNAVHTFELNLLEPSTFSQRVAGLDPEVYLGMVLQNSSDTKLRLPDDVQPSKWLAENFPGAERDKVVGLPSYPNPTLFSLNSLVRSPPGETFMASINALSAFQASLVCPPNKSPENLAAMRNGAVERGASVFLRAGCTTCHPAPFYTTGGIVTNDILKVSSARGINRQSLKGLLVETRLPSFDQMVPLPENPNLITVPPAPGAANNTDLPKGLDTPFGGYKVTGLLGTFFKAPYMHDGSIAVGKGALRTRADGSFEVADSSLVGVPGTTLINRPVSAAFSLRALVDRDLRDILIAHNRSDARLVNASVDGGGHEFFVDPAAGFSYQDQSDLVDFVLALDDKPGEF